MRALRSTPLLPRPLVDSGVNPSLYGNGPTVSATSLSMQSGTGTGTGTGTGNRRSGGGPATSKEQTEPMDFSSNQGLTTFSAGFGRCVC